MYHYVRDLSSSNYPKIKGLQIEEFENQIQYFKKNYTFLSIQDCISAIENNNYKLLPKNGIILTFDDGLIDHYETVFPILVRNKIQGTFFPTAKPILDKTILDVHKIHFILSKVNNVDLLIQEVENTILEKKDIYNLRHLNFYKKKKIVSRYDNKKVSYIKRLLQTELPLELRYSIIDKLFKKNITSDLESFSNRLYMSVDNLREMNESGMIIGSHTYNHFWLNSLTYKEQLKEINFSLEFLSSIGIDFHYLTMCYPYGAYDNNTIKILKEKKFKLAFTTNPRSTNLSHENCLTLERYDANDFKK